jgi:four helix bundle protein
MKYALFMDTIEKIEQLKSRTKQMSLRVIRLYQSLPANGEAQVIGKQLLRSATSVAANYRAVSRARSDAERFSKISIVVEEADETLFWLELLTEAGIISFAKLSELYKECEEILKIVSSTRKNMKVSK